MENLGQWLANINMAGRGRYDEWVIVEIAIGAAPAEGLIIYNAN
jgi:hypothetical protein